MTLNNPFEYYTLIYIQVYLCEHTHIWWGFPGGTSGKEPTCHCRRRKRCGFGPWVRRSHGAEHNNPLQFSCLENPRGQRSLADYSVGSNRGGHEWSNLAQHSTYICDTMIILIYNIHHIYYSENKVIMFLLQFGWETHPFR